MVIDIAFVFLLIFAIFRGLNRGLILGIFSLLAFIIGLAAALKLSAVVANYFKSGAGPVSKWLPVLSFILVFILVVFLVGLGAKLIKKTLQFAMLGWLDSIGGMILYIIIYTIIFSIFLFYAERIMLVKPDVARESNVYPYISGWGPKAINSLGYIIPWFKDMFVQLELFFDGLAKKAA